LLRVRNARASRRNARRCLPDQFPQSVQVASGFLPKGLTDAPH
jgi:hypothetical protein